MAQETANEFMADDMLLNIENRLKVNVGKTKYSEIETTRGKASNEMSAPRVMAGDTIQVVKHIKYLA